MTDRFDAKDLARAVQAGILQPGQDQALLAFLRQRPAQRGSFQLAHVAFYFGAMLIMAAMGWLLTEAWMRIGDWAREHGLADATVSRGFSQVYGVSPSAFRAEVRGRLAWRRIVDAGQALTELAYELGFADQAHMTRAVRAITGKPPRAWRTKVK